MTEPRQNTDRSESLSEAERVDLAAAIDDEYKAHATYAQVIADFGEVRPFSNIVEAEGRHIQALARIFDRYGVPLPDDTWPGRVERFPSLHAACVAGVEDEIDNAKLYDRLLAGTDRADILGVYRNLQEASQERHLQAFQRCADRGDSPPHEGQGRQRRRRRRHGGG